MDQSSADFIHGVLQSLDCDFPFGANAPAEERTVVVTESDRLAWRDVEALRIAARADVATVADQQWTRALSYVARLKVPAVRAWAGRWLAFCTVSGPRPVRHFGEAGKACRAVELALSRLGIVDPEGFEERERPASNRSSKGRQARRRQNRGGDCTGKPTCSCLCGMAQAALAQSRGGK